MKPTDGRKNNGGHSTKGFAGRKKSSEPTKPYFRRIPISRFEEIRELVKNTLKMPPKPKTEE